MAYDATPHAIFNTQSLIRPSNTTTYGAGDVISEVTTTNHYTFDKVPLRGEITMAILTSSSAVATGLDAELYLFAHDIAKVVDNAPFTATDAEMLTLVARIDFPTANWVGSTLSKSCIVTDIGQFYGSGRTLYGQLVARNAYVPTSAEVFTCRLGILAESGF